MSTLNLVVLPPPLARAAASKIAAAVSVGSGVARISSSRAPAQLCDAQSTREGTARQYL